MPEGRFKVCTVCGQKWNVSRFSTAAPYICPHCERKRAREAWQAKKVRVAS